MNIGFDVWGTLVKSSPLFKEAKLLLFKDVFDQNPKDVERAMELVKQEMNVYIEVTGFSPTREFLFNRMYFLLNKKVNQDDELIKDFFIRYDNLFRTFPPLIISEADKYMKDFRGIGINNYIISNTLFTAGKVLNEVLVNIGFRDFKLGFYSDVRKYSKPSIKIIDSTIKLDYMIGDTPKTDGVFAEAIGAKFIQINTNHLTIKDAYEKIVTSES